MFLKKVYDWVYESIETNGILPMVRLLRALISSSRDTRGQQYHRTVAHVGHLFGTVVVVCYP